MQEFSQLLMRGMCDDDDDSMYDLVRQAVCYTAGVLPAADARHV